MTPSAGNVAAGISKKLARENNNHKTLTMMLWLTVCCLD